MSERQFRARFLRQVRTVSARAMQSEEMKERQTAHALSERRSKPYVVGVAFRSCRCRVSKAVVLAKYPLRFLSTLL